MASLGDGRSAYPRGARSSCPPNPPDVATPTDAYIELMTGPQKVLITRASGADHEVLHHAPGLVMFIPRIGESMRMFLDSGELVQTSPVTSVANNGNEIVVDTRNSRYRLELAS